MAECPPENTDERKTSTTQEVDVAVRDGPDIVLDEGTLDPVYTAKARILNKAIQDIGMGKYQWQVSNILYNFSTFPILAVRMIQFDILVLSSFTYSKVD